METTVRSVEAICPPPVTNGNHSWAKPGGPPVTVFVRARHRAAVGVVRHRDAAIDARQRVDHIRAAGEAPGGIIDGDGRIDRRDQRHHVALVDKTVAEHHDVGEGLRRGEAGRQARRNGAGQQGGASEKPLHDSSRPDFPALRAAHGCSLKHV
jgi:hypothetical protein